jgi:DNA-binding MarR family transcriptional regulator
MKTNRLTKENERNEDSEKLDELIRLQQFSIALELLKIGSTQQQMAKSLGVSKTTINNMLKGISIEK